MRIDGELRSYRSAVDVYNEIKCLQRRLAAAEARVESLRGALESTRKPPCPHPGCYSHVTHPCEVCGRINGFTQEVWEELGALRSWAEVRE